MSESATDATTLPVQLTSEHLNAANHQRRILVQYDPSNDIQQEGGFGSSIDAIMAYVFDYADQPGSQIDAICLDVGTEGVVQYRSAILPPVRHPGLQKWRAEGIDYFARLIDEGHRRGKEIWWGLRTNGTDRGPRDSGHARNSWDDWQERNPVKAAHPEWLIRSWWWQGFWNYAHPAVRAYRLSIIQEVVERYDFDGVHLDFLRHTPNLPPGRQWQNRESLTSFMRDVRTMLQARAAVRGRPILLAARIPDSLAGCHIDGIDAAAWAAQGLVDVLVLGTRTINVDVESFRQATAGSAVKLIPSFDTFHAADGYQGDQPLDLLRGVYGNYLHQGADGVGIFNTCAGEPEHAERLGTAVPQGCMHPLLRQAYGEIGSLRTIAGKERFYAIDRRGGYPYCEGYGSSNAEAPLPMTLRYDGTPAEMVLPVWEPVPSGTEVILRLILQQHVAADEVAVLLNGVSLERVAVDAQWKDQTLFCPGPQPETMTPRALNNDLEHQKLTRVEFAVPATALRRGANVLAVSVDRRGQFPPAKSVSVQKVELHLT